MPTFKKFHLIFAFSWEIVKNQFRLKKLLTSIKNCCKVWLKNTKMMSLEDKLISFSRMKRSLMLCMCFNDPVRIFDQHYLIHLMVFVYLQRSVCGWRFPKFSDVLEWRVCHCFEECLQLWTLLDWTPAEFSETSHSNAPWSYEIIAKFPRCIERVVSEPWKPTEKYLSPLVLRLHSKR